MAVRVLVALALGSVVAVAADPAAAGTVRLIDVRGQTAVSFTAAAGERNDVAMGNGGPNWIVQDLVGNPIMPVLPCQLTFAGLGNAATCPADRVDFAVAELGDGNDHITLAMAGTSPGVISGGDGSDGFFGSQGNDELDGGPGDDRIDGFQGMDKLVGGSGLDTLIGGEGGDVIDARDGERDEIECGAGPDRVFADGVDALAADCEEVAYGGEAPSAITVVAAEVGRTSALLFAVVNPHGFATEVRFEYHPLPGRTSITEPVAVGPGKGDVVVTALAVGLTPGTTYHFRAVATSKQGTSYGVYSSFTTQRRPRACVVPRLRGRSLAAARAALVRGGCRLGSVRRVGSRVRRGTVVGQRSRPGARLPFGAHVDLQVSRGTRG